MTNPDKYVPHESSDAETEAIKYALGGVFANSECIAKDAEISLQRSIWMAGGRQFVAVEKRPVCVKDDLLARSVQSLLQGKVVSLEVDQNDPKLSETRETARITSYGVSEDGLYEFRHYHYKDDQLQVINQVMTGEQFKSFSNDSTARARYTDALDVEFGAGMYPASEDEWEDFKVDLVSFPTD